MNPNDIALQLKRLSQNMLELQKAMDVLTSSDDLQRLNRIDSPAHLGQQLNVRRKTLGLDIATLELQSGVSSSTLKRLFKDPEHVKFGTVFAVARMLGVALCTDV